MNTTDFYPALQDLTGTHSSLPAAHDTTKTPEYLHGLEEDQEKAAKSRPVITG